MSQDQDHSMDDSEHGCISTPGHSTTLQPWQRPQGHFHSRVEVEPSSQMHSALHLGVHYLSSQALHIIRLGGHLEQGQEDLTCLHRERDSLRDRLRETEQKVDSLRCEVHDMETRLHAQNSAPSYTTVTKSQRPALAPAKCTNVASKPTFVLKVTNTPQAVAPPVVSPTPKPSKGKAIALPTMDYEVLLAYDDNEYGSDFDPTENAAEEAKAVDSPTGRLVVAILNGTVPTCAVGPSGSNSVEGRVPDLCPASNAEFQLALHALKQAHAERNVHKGNLLLSIQQYISNCHRTDTTSQMTVQRSSLNQWRAPSWAEKLKYDPKTGMVKPMGVTKEEDRNQRAQEEKDGPTKQALLLLAISDRLGLTVNGVPDPRLGIISSPRHEDHPLLWMEWATKVTRILPKGVTLMHNEYPYEWVI
ncbi:hypothetical protein PILCRDRAFT_7804 [Piloderma croceum F 1598]|uniref:Uncharacterized protein n=1 Tax=Piloderma croceum (strain F 1598) TaxID=765440 RepID=A0A0C3B7W9_PILCF|nr:hypothetical protein PILCRDRAFT_7804 [Piloderma croceum F 1598]